MLQNEKGFTYPLILMMIILFCFFFSYQVQFYLSEKKFFHESIVILKQEYYMHTAVKKIETELQSNILLPRYGQYDYQTGLAIFQVESYSSNLIKITITIKLNTLEEIVGYAYYDINQKKMTKWLERN
jgi:competence protein ComGG